MSEADSKPAVENRANLDAGFFETLAGALNNHRSIKDALDWLMAQVPPLTIADLVTQDEFSHDALTPYPGGLWLAWSVT
jgi:hypothetical protein